MKELEQQREVIRNYLLGTLTEERREQVEQRLMTDSDYRDEVLMVESELVEDYLSDTLSADECDKFDKHYLSAPRQQKNLKLTKVLLKKAAQSTKPLPAAKPNLFRRLIIFFQSSGPRLQLATVSLILLAVVGAGVVLQMWRLRETSGLREELAQLNTAQSILSPDSAVASATLLPVSVREQGALPRVTITPTVKVIQLRVPITSNAYQNYKVELRTIEGEQVVEFESQRQAGEPLIVQLPARILEPNDYMLTVSALNAQGLTENLGEYAFRVLQQ